MMPSSIAGIPMRRLAATLAIAASTTFLLFGYEFVRSVAQSLFVECYGLHNLPWIMAASPIGTLLMVYAYGRLLSRVGPRLAILLSAGFSAVIFVLLHRALSDRWAPASAILYVFREGYIVLMVEQVWSFLNSTLSDAEGRKLNGLVCGVATIGPIVGGTLVGLLAESWGSANLLLPAALALVPAGLLAVVAFNLAGEPAPRPEEAHGRRGHLGLRELAQSPMLRRMALLILLTQTVSTVFELNMNTRLKALYPLADARTAWFGSYYALLNVLAALFQFVLTPLAIRNLPLRLVHTVVPLLNVAAATLSLAIPGLTSAAAAYMVFKVLDYSTFRAAKEILFIPLSFDARYRAKEVIDAFGYRLGKGVSSAAFAAFQGIHAIPLAVYPLTALAALGGWIPAARRMVDASRMPAKTRGMEAGHG